MATRVTEEDVLAILATDTELDYGMIDPYITSANVFITGILEGKLSDPVLFEIERWLSAHMASVSRERLAKEEGAGGAYIKYAGEWGDALASTQYGQMVLMLDTSNTLSNLSKGKYKAWIVAIPGV